SRQRKPLLHASRKCFDHLICRVSQAVTGEYFAGINPSLVQAGVKLKIFDGRQLRIQQGLVCKVANSRFVSVRRYAKNFYLAAVRKQAGDAFEQRAFPGSIWPKQTQDTAGVQVKTDFFEKRREAYFVSETLNAQGWLMNQCVVFAFLRLGNGLHSLLPSPPRCLIFSSRRSLLS